MYRSWLVATRIVSSFPIFVILDRIRNVICEFPHRLLKCRRSQMRSGLVISVLVPSIGLLTACSSVTTSAPAAISPSPSPSQSCALALQAWLQGNGGQAFHEALSASSAMRSALKSNSQTSAESQAQRLNSAARRADDHLPPACADHGRHYQLAMGDWLVGARDATHGNLL